MKRTSKRRRGLLEMRGTRCFVIAPRQRLYQFRRQTKRRRDAPDSFEGHMWKAGRLGWEIKKRENAQSAQRVRPETPRGVKALLVGLAYPSELLCFDARYRIRDESFHRGEIVSHVLTDFRVPSNWKGRSDTPFRNARDRWRVSGLRDALPESGANSPSPLDGRKSLSKTPSKLR